LKDKQKPGLEAIKERAENATDGPWENSRTDGTHIEWARNNIDSIVKTINYGGSNKSWSLVTIKGSEVICANVGFGPDSQENAEFIAHAREDIPQLLAYIEELEEYKWMYEDLCK